MVFNLVRIVQTLFYMHICRHFNKSLQLFPIFLAKREEMRCSWSLLHSILGLLFKWRCSAGNFTSKKRFLIFVKNPYFSFSYLDSPLPKRSISVTRSHYATHHGHTRPVNTLLRCWEANPHMDCKSDHYSNTMPHWLIKAVLQITPLWWYSEHRWTQFTLTAFVTLGLF